MADVSEHLVPDPQQRGAWLVRVSGVDQSYIDPDDPTHLEFDYLERIAAHLDAHAPTGQRLRVIHVGGAGMSLARYVDHTRPTSAQIVLEPDADLVAEVRATVPLPPRSGIKVRPQDGRTGLAVMPDDYADVVILDAFADASVPADLVTLECFADVRRVLHSDGLLVANATDSQPFDWLRRVLAGFTTSFAHVMIGAEPSTLKRRRFGNIVVAASDQPLPMRELARRSAGSPFPYAAVSGQRLTDFIAGARPFTDADTAPSPSPFQRLTWFG